MSIETSQTVGALAAALAKAQAEIEGAAKDRVNPHFKSSYATLASVWDACRPALSKHGIAVVQAPASDGQAVTVHTTLLHASGEWMRSSLTASARDGSPQSVGSAVTYLRRYSLAAMVGVAPEDDDANAAQPQFDQRPRPAPAPPHPAVEAAKRVFPEAKEDVWTAERLRAAMERLVPGNGREPEEARLDELARLMEYDRTQLRRGQSLYSVFAEGAIHLREGLIKLVEKMATGEAA